MYGFQVALRDRATLIMIDCETRALTDEVNTHGAFVAGRWDSDLAHEEEEISLWTHIVNNFQVENRKEKKT